MSDDTHTMWEGRYLKVLKTGTWEYAARTGSLGAAVIVAIDDGHILLVEQYRRPFARACLELPAGLVGDDTEGESVESAATRELEEETGYRPARIEILAEFASSPGMTSETFTLVRAHDLVRTGDGGGHDGEDITVHRVALSDVAAFVAGKRADGVVIDTKLMIVLAGSLLA